MCVCAHGKFFGPECVINGTATLGAVNMVSLIPCAFILLSNLCSILYTIKILILLNYVQPTKQFQSVCFMWCAHSLTYEAIDGKGIEETAKAAKLHTKLVTLRNRKRRTKKQQQRASKKKIAADLMATCMKFISCTYNFTSLAINIKCKANKQRNNVDDDWIVAWAENDYNIRSTGIGI